jgi:hypothetical protein
MPLFDLSGTSMAVTYQQLQCMLQGIALKKIEYRKRYQVHAKASF